MAMTVQDVMRQLAQCDPQAKVTVTRKNNDGCKTCGYGATSSEIDVTEVTDLETRVALTLDE